MSLFDITVTNGRTRVRFTESYPCWYAAMSAAFDKYGIPSVVTVAPSIEEPAEDPQLCLV